MPRLDGTGPQGAGPMTGRGAGPCNNGQGRANAGRGRGRGFGRGFFGRGQGWFGRFGQNRPDSSKEDQN